MSNFTNQSNLSKQASCILYANLTPGTSGMGVFFVSRVAEKTDINGFKFIVFSVRTVDNVPITARMFRADEWINSITEPLSALSGRPVLFSYCTRIYEGRLNLVIDEVRANTQYDLLVQNFQGTLAHTEEKLQYLRDTEKYEFSPQLLASNSQSIASSKLGGVVDFLYRVLFALDKEDTKSKTLAKEAFAPIVQWILWRDRNEESLPAAKIKFLHDIVEFNGSVVAEIVADVLGFMPASYICAHKVARAYKFVLDAYHLDDLQNSMLGGYSIIENGVTYTI